MELEKKLEDLGRAFDEYKKVNDKRLEEAKAGKSTTELEQKQAKIDADINRLEDEVKKLTTALGRAAQGGNAEENDEQKMAREEKEMSKKYRQELDGFLRKGRDVSAEAAAWSRKSMSSDSDQDGGFLVSPEMSSEIVKKIYESSPIRQLASVQTISTNSLKIIEDLGEAGSGWVGERESRTETTTPGIKEIEIPVHELYAEPRATQGFLDDASINVEAWLADKVGDKFLRDEATAFVSGSGVKKPKGILTYASGSGFGYLERTGTASATALTGDELIDLQASLKEAYQGNAVWLMNRLIVAYVRKLKDSQGRYLWEPGLAQGAPAMLLGKPVEYASDLASSLTANAEAVIYGNIKAGYQVVDRVGIRVLRDPFTAKPYIKFYTTKRVGGGVKDFDAIKILKQHA